MRILTLSLLSLACMGSACALPVTLTVRGAGGQPVADAVIAVELRGRASKTTTAKADMAQRDRQFQPAVLVVQTGTAVNFPNFDTVRHHVYSFSPIKVVDIKLYAGTPSEPVVFDKAGVATLGCNIHDRMSAHIVVVDTPLFGQTDAKGQITFELPAGEHQLKAWRPGQKAANLQAVAFKVSAASTQPVIELSD